jgi:hypothetical protein
MDGRPSRFERRALLETSSYLETLTTELSNKIWQKISLPPRD